MSLSRFPVPSDRSGPVSSRSARQLLAASWRKLARAGEPAVTSGNSTGGPVPADSPDRTARSLLAGHWRQLVATWRTLEVAWWVVAVRWLHPLANQVPFCQERQPGHPDWCSQSGCHTPRAFADGTVEWDHHQMTTVEHIDGVADVFLVRMDGLRGGTHDVEKTIVLTANGTFTADQAEAYAVSILRAVRRLDAGLPGTPGGIPAVLAQLPEMWPASGRNRAV